VKIMFAGVHTNLAKFTNITNYAYSCNELIIVTKTYGLVGYLL